MEFSIPQPVVYIAAWLGLIGGVWGIFERAETVIKDDLRRQISTWLKSDFSEKIDSDLPSMFINIFDNIFGKKHLSFKCFFRSCIVSIIAVIIMSFIFQAVTHFYSPSVFKELYSGILLIILWIFILFFGAILNFIPDYLSLLETRLVINKMRGKHFFSQINFLFIDILLTIAIFFCSALILLSTFTTIRIKDFFSIKFIMLLCLTVKDLILFWNESSILPSGILLLTLLPIFLYSTFFTSVWVWLYFGSSMIVKLLRFIGLSINRIGFVFDVDEKPLRSLGFVCIIGITIIFIIIPFIN